MPHSQDEERAPTVKPRPLAIGGGVLLGSAGALFLTAVLLAAPGHLEDWAVDAMLGLCVMFTFTGVAALACARRDRREFALLRGQIALRRQVGRLEETIMRHIDGTVADPLPQRRGRADDHGVIINGRDQAIVDAEFRGFLAARSDPPSLPPADSTGWGSSLG